MDAILKNKKNNSELLEKGYTVMEFADTLTVKRLLEYYQEHPNNFPHNFHASHFSTDTAYKRKVHQFILNEMASAIENTFNNCQAVFANYMVKEAGGDNPMPLHADWTYVEESVSSSYAIWLPLVDTSVENGCIGVIPFSQHLSHPIRGPRILQWEYSAGDILIGKMGTLLPMRAGQAFIYNHRTLHYSPPNNSGQARPAINVSLVPVGEKIIHYTIPEGETQILKFEVPGDDFFLDYDNFQMPRQGILLGKLSPGEAPLLNGRVEDFISKYAHRSSLSFLKRLFTRTDRIKFPAKPAIR
ncbi:MAG TPA: phytanoyl-CoA dioxygenase family protein [Chitinophagales bacterium]|nr:phytanoyl-CoA dioxygenase family protein [Chitinophagales bacterium]